MKDKINLPALNELSNGSRDFLCSVPSSGASAPALVNTENYRPDLQTFDSRGENRNDYDLWQIIQLHNLEDRMKANRREELTLRFQAQREIKSVLYGDLKDSNASVLKCMTTPFKDFVTLKRKAPYETILGSPVLDGLIHCHCVHVCPIDAPAIYVTARHKIRQLCYMAKKSDYELYFGTVTVRHSWNDSLALLLQKFHEAMVGFWADRAIKDILKQIKGRVTSLEITFGFDAGFHPHFHILFIGAKGLDCVEIGKTMESRLLAYYGKKGLSGKEGIAFDFKPCESVEDYLTKIPCELSLGNVTKHGHGEHYTFFQMAILASQTKDKKRRALLREKMKEYYYATKGRHAIQFSKGLLSFFGLEDFSDTIRQKPLDGCFPSVRGSDFCKLSHIERAELSYFVSLNKWGAVYELLEKKGVEYWRSDENPYDDLVEMSENEFNSFVSLSDPLRQDTKAIQTDLVLDQKDSGEF